MTTIEQLLECNDEQLFERAGRLLTPTEFGPSDVGALIQLGRAWFEAQADRLRSHVCYAPSVVVLLAEDKEYNRLLEITAIMQTLTGFFGKETQLVFAVLIVKQGLAQFCRTRD